KPFRAVGASKDIRDNTATAQSKMTLVSGRFPSRSLVWKLNCRCSLQKHADSKQKNSDAFGWSMCVSAWWWQFVIQTKCFHRGAKRSLKTAIRKPQRLQPRKIQRTARLEKH